LYIAFLSNQPFMGNVPPPLDIERLNATGARYVVAPPNETLTAPLTASGWRLIYASKQAEFQVFERSEK
jgi:hypothetical protein